MEVAADLINAVQGSDGNMSDWRELESNSWWNVGGDVRENA